MIERGILPEGTELTPINPMTPGTFSEGDSMRPWDELYDDEKRLFSRMAEVYAGFSEYTDHQVGRIVDYLEESGQLDNTLILYCADNGASGEGSPNGSVNENKFFNAWPDTVEDNLPMIDKLGSPDTYNHYPTGWAVAFSTPYRMFKRYSYQGGVCDPLVIHWPAGIAGARRGPHPVPPLHRHRPDDPRLLRRRDARRRRRLRADAAARRLDALLVRRRRRADRARRRSTTRCSARAGSGTRAGRRSPSTGPSRSTSASSTRTAGSSSTPTRTAPRRTTSPTSTPRSSRSSRRCGSRRRRSTTCCRSTTSASSSSARSSTRSRCPTSGQYTYYPGTSEVPEASAASTTNVSHRILAEVEFTPDSQGVIVAQGSRFGGFSLFVKDGKLTYAYNFLGIPPEQRIVADAPTSGTHIVGIEFTKERTGEHHEPHGPLKLFVDDEVVAEEEIRTDRLALQPVRRGPVHRLRRRRRGQQRVHAAVRVHRRAHRQGRLRRRRRRVRRRRARDGGGHGP